MAKPKHLFSDNAARMSGNESSRMLAGMGNDRTIGAQVAGGLLSSFDSSGPSAIAQLINHDPSQNLNTSRSATQVGAGVAVNAAAGQTAKGDLEAAQTTRASTVDQIKEAQSPIKEALVQSAGHDAAQSFLPGHNSDTVSLASNGAMALAGAKMPFSKPMINALNGASAASLYSDTLGSVKGHVSDTVKQEIAGMIAAKLSLKFDSNTGAYTSDVEHDLPTPVVEKMENLAQEDPAALVKYIEELLVDPEQSDVVQAIDDAIVDLQKDVDDFQKIRPENDQLFVVARRAGVNASEITLSQVADVAKVEAAGGDVVATVTTAEIQMFELPNYPATFSAQDINFAAKPDVESALAIKSSELEKVSFATMNREPDMRAFSNPSGMRI